MQLDVEKALDEQLFFEAFRTESSGHADSITGCADPRYAAMGQEQKAASTFTQAFQSAGEKSSRLAALAEGAQKSGLCGMWEVALPPISQNDEKQDPFGTATAYMYAGDNEKALALLERAYQQRAFGITWIAVDPTFDSLRSERGFQVLVGRHSQE